MKAIKYLISGVLAMALAAPSMAQDVNYQTALEPVSKAIVAKSADAAELAKKYQKEFKKNPEALVALGKVYFGEKRYDDAKAIAQALTDNKKFANCGDAWILLGDIAVAEAENGDAGPAAAMYETAISVDPKNKTAYERYFTVNRTAAPEEAIRKLEEYKKIDPSYQIEAKVADMYYKQNTIGGMKDAVEWYKKGDANNYDETNFTQWANANYILRNYDDAVNVAKRGLAKFNNSVYLSRAALYAAAEKGDFQNALEYGKDMFKDNKDSLALDYYYYGISQLGVKDYQNAVTSLNKALEINPKDLRPMGKLSQAYLGLGQEDKALDYSQKYLEQATSVGYDDYNNLSEIYKKKGDAAKGTQQKDFYNKAMDVWEIMAKKSPAIADYAYFQEAQIAQDKLKDQAKVRELNQKIISTDEAITNLSSTNKQLLTYAYINEAINYNNANEIDKAKELAQKVLAIDPNNETAKKILAVGAEEGKTE